MMRSQINIRPVRVPPPYEFGVRASGEELQALAIIVEGRKTQANIPSGYVLDRLQWKQLLRVRPAYEPSLKERADPRSRLEPTRTGLKLIRDIAAKAKKEAEAKEAAKPKEQPKTEEKKAKK